MILRVLVTGGAGFIGSNFITRSLETRNNLEITILDSMTYAADIKNLEGALPHIKLVKGDIRDVEAVEKLVSKSELVVHFAAESHNDNSLSNPNIFFETNVMGTLNVVRACSRNSVRMHHVSTDEVFGDLPLDSNEEFDISTPYNPSSPYSASKAASDLLVRAWVRSFGLDATISNCSNNYGPRQHWEKFIPASLKRIFEGSKPLVYGDGQNVRDWIHVDDHTDGIWSILDRGIIGGTYLLGARNRKSNIDLLRSMLALFDLPSDFVIFGPDRPGHDRKYAINPESANSIGWFAKKSDIEDNLPELARYYRERYLTERSQK